MTEFPFERGELLSNLTLLEDHADKFQCPWCMEKHTSKIIGYAEEIALGGEDTKTMKELAEEARKWRRFVQGAKEHSHETVSHSCEDLVVDCVKSGESEAECRKILKCQ